MGTGLVDDPAVVVGGEREALLDRHTRIVGALDGADHAAQRTVSRRLPRPMSGPEVSVVMPCLNEAETLGVCVDKAHAAMAELGVEGEVLVADNGSDDGSPEIAREHGARVIAVPERGYGAALQAGIAAAGGRYVVMGDADNSYDFSALGVFVERLRQGHDLVAGNRFAGGILPGAMPRLHKLGNPFLTAAARRLFRSPVGDIYCGLRGFDRERILALDLRSTGMEYAIEMVVKASLYGLRIAEVPTTLSPDGRTRKPHLRTWRDGWRSLRFLLLYSPNWLFFSPGVALFAVGAAGLLWRLAVGGSPVGMIPFAIGTIVGVQAMLFSVMAKLFAMTEGLLPPERRMIRLFRYVTLEVGLLAGITGVLAGIVLAVLGITQTDPGDTRVGLELTAGLLVGLGCQVVLSSFLISILGLGRAGNPVRPAYLERAGQSQ